MEICHMQSIIYNIIWNYKSHGESTNTTKTKVDYREKGKQV